MPCPYYMHHDPWSESDESGQITVVTENNRIWADGFLIIWKPELFNLNTQPPLRLQQPTRDRGEKQLRAEDEIGLASHIWKDLPYLIHTIVVGRKSTTPVMLITQAIWDPPQKRDVCVCVYTHTQYTDKNCVLWQSMTFVCVLHLTFWVFFAKHLGLYIVFCSIFCTYPTSPWSMVCKEESSGYYIIFRPVDLSCPLLLHLCSLLRKWQNVVAVSHKTLNELTF